MGWWDNEKLKEVIHESGTGLLSFHQTAEWNAMKCFATYKNIMITVSMTLIAAGVAAVANDKPVIVLLAMLVPIIMAGLRQYSIETLDRYYARFLEAVVVQHKILWALDLIIEQETPFKNDQFLEVSRRASIELQRKSDDPEKESALWVRQKLEEGHNNVVWRIFRAFFLASVIILPLAAGMRLLTWPDKVFSNNKCVNATWIAVLIGVSLLVSVGFYLVGTMKIREKRTHEHTAAGSKARV